MLENIPRRIIQTGKTRKERDLSLPNAFDVSVLTRACGTNLRLLNPDFEYLFFDDAQVNEFIDTEFPQYRPVFDSFPMPIQRYDFFRYLAVYRLGGFYFDTDVLLASPLDDLLGVGCVFPFERLSINRFLSEEYGMDWDVGNYAFGAAAGHPFLKAIIKNCIRAQQHPEWVDTMLKPIPVMFRREEFVLASTGPALVSRTLAEYPGAREQVKVLFPEDVIDKSGWNSFGAYGVHLQFGSWKKTRGLAYRMLHRVWESRTREALLKESLRRGRKRTLEFTPCNVALDDSRTRVFETDQRSVGPLGGVSSDT